ncbi:hypothetical protein RUND412_004824 [Rhizina undulata]
MDTVPTEILREIISYFPDRSDLNSLRLVNRKMSAAANIFKFRALKVRVTRKGLDNLLNISRQPELALYVREITYPHCRLAPMQNPYLEAVKLYMDQKQFLAVEWLAATFFDWYTDSYDAQIGLEESGECVRILESALSRMLNIGLSSRVTTTPASA